MIIFELDVTLADYEHRRHFINKLWDHYHELKERWLNEVVRENRTIEFVFDSDPKSVEMWKRRGVFVFNCLQHDEEF